jgi:hypothetical protein
VILELVLVHWLKFFRNFHGRENVPECRVDPLAKMVLFVFVEKFLEVTDKIFAGLVRDQVF